MGAELAGGIAAERLFDEHRRTVRIGYWLGRDFYGRGLATAACRALGAHIFATTDALRLEAAVYHPNVASMKVLEKCGYAREGVMRNAVTKGEHISDAHLYAKVREVTSVR